MGKLTYCDFCGKEQQIGLQLDEVKVGIQVLGEACYNCAGQLKLAFGKMHTDTKPDIPAPIKPPEADLEPELQPAEPENESK